MHLLVIRLMLLVILLADNFVAYNYSLESCYKRPWTYEYITLKSNNLSYSNITVQNMEILEFALKCGSEKGFVLPLTIPVNEDLMTDVYGYIHMTTECENCYNRLVEDYFTKINPTHYGKQSFQDGCADEIGVLTGDYSSFASCFSLMYYSAQEKLPRYFTGQLSYNHVPQDIRIANKSILRVLWEKKAVCYVIFRRDPYISTPKKKCYYMITPEVYAMHCCCYEGKSCYIPNRQKFLSSKAEIGITINQKRDLTCAVGTADEKNMLENPVLVEVMKVAFTGKQGGCFSTFVFNGDALSIELSPITDQTNHLNNMEGNSTCKLLRKICPLSYVKEVSYTVWCACKDEDMCNAYTYMKVLKQWRTKENYRFCNLSIPFTNIFGADSRTYMCSIHYSHYHKRNIFIDTTVNAKIFGEIESAYNTEDGHFVLFSVDTCEKGENEIVPVFVQSCGPKGQWNTSKNCDERLVTNVMSFINDTIKKLNPCVVAHFNATSIEEAKRLLKTDKREFPDESLFCYVKLIRHTWNNDMNKPTSMYEIKLGALPYKSKEFDDCENAHLMWLNGYVSDTICKEQMCCCFVGSGFEKCDLIEGALKLIHQYSVINNPLQIVDEWTKIEKIRRRGCAISAAIDVLEAKSYGQCWESIGCFRFQQNSFFDHYELGHMFKVYAGCTSEINAISQEYHMANVAAVCMTIKTDEDKCFMVNTDAMKITDEEQNTHSLAMNETTVRLCCCGLKGCSKTSKNFGYLVN